MTSQFCTQCSQRLEPNVRFCAACGTAVSARTAKKPPRRQRRKKRRPLPWPLLILVVGGALLILGGLLYRANPPAVVDVPDDHDASGLPYPTIPRISAAETKARVDGGTAVIIDVRSSQEYAEAHIPNALSIPLDELQQRYQELASNAEIITYCT